MVNKKPNDDKDDDVAEGQTEKEAPAERSPSTTPILSRAPTRGRILDYTDGEGNVMPAIVTSVVGADMHLQGWHEVVGCKHQYIAGIADRERKKSGEPNTWNWPELVPNLPELPKTTK